MCFINTKAESCWSDQLSYIRYQFGPLLNYPSMHSCGQGNILSSALLLFSLQTLIPRMWIIYCWGSWSYNSPVLILYWPMPPPNSTTLNENHHPSLGQLLQRTSTFYYSHTVEKMLAIFTLSWQYLREEPVCIYFNRGTFNSTPCF